MKLMEITDRYKESIMSYREAFLQSHDSLIHGSGELDQYDHYEDWKRWNQVMNIRKQCRKAESGQSSFYSLMNPARD